MQKPKALIKLPDNAFVDAFVPRELSLQGTCSPAISDKWKLHIIYDHITLHFDTSTAIKSKYAFACGEQGKKVSRNPTDSRGAKATHMT